MTSRLLPLRRRPFATSLLSFLFLILLFGSLPCPAAPASVAPLRITGGDLYGSNGFRIEFSRPLTNAERNVDSETLKALVAISPEAPFSVSGYYNRDIYLQMKVSQKPTTCYTVTFKKGFPIPGAPESLECDMSLSFITPDLPSSFRYASNGHFFPLHAPVWELPITSTNLDTDVEVALAEAYPNRIVDYLLLKNRSYGYDSTNFFREIRRQKLTLKTPRNQQTARALALEEVGVPRGRPGFYLLTTSYNQKDYSYYSHRYYDGYDSTRRLVVVTDMALFVSSCGTEHAIQVRRLSDPAQPVAGVRLELYSNKEQLLWSGVTDQEGLCRLQKPLLEDKDDWQALLLARNPQDGDTAYLYWESYAADQTPPLTALFLDRDICRPGEQLQVTADLRRREDGTAMADVPLELVLLDTSRSEMVFQPVKSDACGLAQATFRIPAGALLGSYTVVLRAAGGGDAPVYNSASFLVSEFTPDQIEGKVEMALSEKGIRYDGKAAYYFGLPASQADVKLRLTASWASFKAPDAYRGYIFGGVEEELPGTLQTATTADEAGLFSGEIAIAPKPAEWRDAFACARPIRLDLQAEIAGGAGTRPVTARIQEDFHFTDSYLGVRILPEETSAAANVRRVSLVALDPKGNPVPLPEGLTCRLSRPEWHYLLKEAWDGSCRREWQCVDELVSEFPVAPNEKGEFDLTLPCSDNYVLLFKAEEGKRVLCRTDFWHWAGESAAHSPNPTRLDFSLDRQEYLPGQTAKVTFVAEQDGEALVTAGTEGIPMRLFSRPVKAGKNTIEVEIPRETVRGRWFVAVTAVGKITTEENGRPIDAPHQSGVATLVVRQDGRRLDVGLESPDVCATGADAALTVTLKDNAGRPVAGEVVLWGVDEGVLALTGYGTPDIHDRFFGKLECPIDTRDLYGTLYPMLRVVNGVIGGGFACDMAGAPMESAKGLSKYRQERQGQPPAERVLRLGIVHVGADGKAQVPFRAPSESGALRLMAVAANATAVGSAEKRLTVHAAATVQCLAPQAVAPGDSFRVLCSLFNHDVQEPRFTWEISADGSAVMGEGAAREGEAAPGASFSFFQEIAVPEDAPPGPLTLRAKVTDANGNTYAADTCVVQIRSSVLRLPEVTSLVLAPGESRRFHFESGEYGTLEVGSPMLPLMRHIRWLNDYPYGCLEQTVAAAFPQLAVPALVQLNLIPEGFSEAARTKVTAALERLATMRCGSHYSMWPGGREPWIEGSLFAYLFILEADRQGFTLPEGRRREIVSNLRFFLNCRDNNHVERALATYALSLAAPELALEYVKLLPLEEEVPQAGQIRFLAAMSLIQGGFAAEGNTLLKALEKTGGLGAFGGGAQDASPLDSPVRSTGLALWLLAEKLPEHPLVEKLAADLLRLESADASYYTTHEHAWAALGLSQYLAACLMNSRNGAGMKKPEGPSLLESGARHAATLDLQPLGGGAERRTWEDSGFGQQKPCRVTDFGGDILVTNTGDAELLVETSRRVAQPRTKPVRNGLAVARKFYSAAGLPVLECTAGDLLEVQITLKGKAAGDVVICDLLPGGFEIEDPTLLTRTVVPPYQAPKEGEAVFFVPKLLERRFDRMLAFGNFRGCEDNQAGLVLRYHVRAVAPGRYSIPQTQAEPMYNPRMNALSAAPEEPFVIHPRQP